MWRWLEGHADGVRMFAALIVAVAVAVLVGLMAWVVIDGSLARREARELATESAKAAQAEVARGIDSRQASTARINGLQDRITQLIDTTEEANRLLGESAAREAALIEQVRQLGARPVVVTPRPAPVTLPPAPVTPAPAPAPASPALPTPPTTVPKPPTTTTTRPPTTSTTKPSTTTTTTRR